MRSRILALITTTMLLALACDSADEGPSLSDFDSDRDEATTRVPAEWEPQESVWLQWPQDHEASYRPSFVKMIEVIAQYETVDLLVADAALQAAAQKALEDAGVGLDNIRFRVAPYDGLWIRDVTDQLTPSCIRPRSRAT